MITWVPDGCIFLNDDFEASAMFELRKSPRDLMRMAVWNLAG
jgi:hypothetical protein